jgi:hypothetical protein
MRAAWYQKQGLRGMCWWSARCRTLIPPRCAFRIAASASNLGDIKKLRDSFGLGMSYPRVIPHSDGAGMVDRSVMACHRNGSVDECGVTAHNPIAHSEQLQSLQWCCCIMSLPCRMRVAGRGRMPWHSRHHISAPYMSG